MDLLSLSHLLGLCYHTVLLDHHMIDRYRPFHCAKVKKENVLHCTGEGVIVTGT